jgi:hypothetical protein
VKASEKLIRILVDGDKDGKLFEKYGVQSMPTLIYLDPEGKKVGQMTARSADALKAQFEEIATKHGRAPAWLEGSEPALAAGKEGTKPAVLLFADEKPKSQAWQRIFSDPAFGTDLYEKAAFAKVEFKKDSEECKKWKVTEGGTLLIVDPTGEGTVIKTLKTGTPKGVRKDIEDAVKKLAAKK